ncbi:Lipid-phosphate phosphatase [Heracleum sosnowskyi]|uniref:Lipid-phosphate phosphatase n=1 Tax=Heracleum sosnowskyi TaxID=360622 RepID=A0AAD8ING9_9APIA|nr:Lipid-phosphate phosphatase [Heracleum sosnowskyi]
MALLDVIAPKEKVFVVAHDWGAYIAWHLSLFRPDKVEALVNLSVHYLARNPMGDIVKLMEDAYGEDYYMFRFQKPGDMEGKIATDIGTKTFIKKFLSHRKPGPFYFPKGTGYNGDSKDSPLPSWLSEEDLDYYSNKYEKTGFTGPHQLLSSSSFNMEAYGTLDRSSGFLDFIHNGEFQKFVPLLQEVVVMEGVGHFITEEKPDDINKHILSFLQQF